MKGTGPQVHAAPAPPVDVPAGSAPGAGALPQQLREYVGRFVARRRAIELLRAGGVAIALALGLLVTSCLLDRWLRLPAALRLVLLVANALVFLLVLLRPLRRVLHSRMDWVQAATEIEQMHPVFGQRLVTAVSQILDRPEYRGSPDFIDRIVQDISGTLDRRPPSPWVGLRSIWFPWVGAALALALILTLQTLPDVGFRSLAARYFEPLNALPPVTTTQIRVEPGNIRLVRGQTLAVHVHVRKLTRGSVEIATSNDGSVFSSSIMLPVTSDHYVFQMPVLDRDIRYYVRAGDAVSPTYTATVVHPPAVINYAFLYEYPAYTGRPSATATSTDGTIEALTGTRVLLTLHSTEPLQQASLTTGGSRIALALDGDQRHASTSLEVSTSCSADLELVSSAGLTTRVPGAVTIRAIPDRPPMVRLLQPANDLRLSPHDMVTLNYQAMDDYGLTSLDLVWQLNGGKPVHTPLPQSADPRRVEGQYTLDLNSIGAKLGDVITLTVAASDGQGRPVESDPRRHILISPRPIDIATRQRTADLRSCSTLAAGLVKELDRASRALQQMHQAVEDESDHYTQQLDISRALGNAGESAIVLHQLLLRCVSRSPSPQHTLAYAAAVDRARQLVWATDRISQLDAWGLMDNLSTQRFQTASSLAAGLLATVNTLSDGEQAAGILADRANLAASPATGADAQSAPQHVQEALRRARRDIDRALAQLGLSASAPDIVVRLNQRVGAADQLLASAKPVRFEDAARNWVQAVLQSRPMPPLPERLLSACACEAVRPHTSPANARDLQLAARAATHLASVFGRGQDDTSVRQSLEELPAAIEAVQRDHRRARDPSRYSAEQARAIIAAAAQARRKLELWSNRSTEPLDQQRNPDQDDLALVASAEIASHNYTAARRLSERLRQLAEADSRDVPGSEDDLTRVEELDAAAARQSDLAARANEARWPTELNEVARQQRQIAESLGRIETSDVRRLDTNLSPDARRRATAALEDVQEQLAAMPQQLLSLLASADTRRLMAERLEQARKEARTADDADQPAARRSLRLAERDLEEADHALQDAAGPMSPDVASQFQRRITPYEPESTEVIELVDRQLKPALDALLPAARSDSLLEMETAAAHVRTAIELAQNSLRQAQGKLIEQDPLAAARYFADAASTTLEQGDISRVAGYQQNASIALAQAWQDAARGAMLQRLAMAPSFRPILTTQPVENAHGSLADLLPTLRQWSFLRQRGDDSTAAPLSDSDPTGYAEPLRLYFQAIQQMTQEKRNK